MGKVPHLYTVIPKEKYSTFRARDRTAGAGTPHPDGSSYGLMGAQLRRPDNAME